MNLKLHMKTLSVCWQYILFLLDHLEQAVLTFSFQNLYLESAKSKVDVFEEAENELKEIETGLESAETVQPS